MDQSSLDWLSLSSVFDDVADLWSYTRNVLAVFGAFYATKILINVCIKSVSIVRTYIIPRFWYVKDFSIKYGGKWAIITGASDGLGKSFAVKLAQRNMNVLLISRNMDKLNEVENYIKSNYNVEVRCIAIDLQLLSNNDWYVKLQKEIENLDVAVLVNNVGVMYDKLQYFLTVPKERLIRITDLNVNAMILMTNMILPSMVARGNGAIINLGSVAGVQPTPLMTVYSASKAYVDSFSRALDYEYSASGITVQVLHPSYVSTNMTYNGTSNVLLVDSNDYSESALRTLDVSKRCYGYWSHGIFSYIGELMPGGVYMFLATYFNPILWSWLTGVTVCSKKTR